METDRGWTCDDRFECIVNFYVRRLGEAILELLKALRGLSFEVGISVAKLYHIIDGQRRSEVQTSFCEQVSASLLPFLEELLIGTFALSCEGNV